MNIAEVYIDDVESDTILTDYVPPELPPTSRQQRLCGPTVEGFSDPVIDLAVARFKAVSLATAPVQSHLTLSPVSFVLILRMWIPSQLTKFMRRMIEGYPWS